MELRSVVGALTATIAVGTLASSGSLVLITSYLHRLASQIDDNLQSVRAAEEIQLELLWHARNTNLAVLLANPELAAATTLPTSCCRSISSKRLPPPSEAADGTPSRARSACQWPLSLSR